MVIAAIDIVSMIAITVFLTPCIIYLMAVFMDFRLPRRVREFLRYLFNIKSFTIGISIAIICWITYRAISRYQEDYEAKIQFYDEIVD